jgi:hypothetical protein|uniref:Uncharacterized protein n=1 Tax=Thermus sp. WG TaxID=1312524 RepID=R4JCM0_9DEIN|nr:hypothetical protein WG16_08 [Thermus sp. WG]
MGTILVLVAPLTELRDVVGWGVPSGNTDGERSGVPAVIGAG